MVLYLQIGQWVLKGRSFWELFGHRPMRFREGVVLVHSTPLLKSPQKDKNTQSQVFSVLKSSKFS